MTTIAYRDGKLAGDSRATANGLIDNQTTKVWSHKGVLIAASGSQALCEKFRTWVVAGMDGESPFEGADDGNGLVVSMAGVVCFGNTGSWPISEPFYTLGSGYQLALGALAMGASAEEAVEIASRFDTMTGGKITVLSLN